MLSDLKKRKWMLFGVGGMVGILSALLSFAGNPTNMGMCIACFIRDSVGALKMHNAAGTCYIRPEIIGIVLGSFAISLLKKEFAPKGGSSTITRFVIAFFMMFGCLMALGCPFRMVLRMAGGDVNAMLAIIGFVAGIGVGVIFLKKGYSLGRSYRQSKAEGCVLPVIMCILLILAIIDLFYDILATTAFGEGPGGMHAPLLVSLIVGLLIGCIAQRSRMCMAGAFRDLMLFRDGSLLRILLGVLAGALVCNLILQGLVSTEILNDAASRSFFRLGMADQSIAHTNVFWNIVGMFPVGMASVLLGGCPLRQLVLAGEGNTDSVACIGGLALGAAFAHNFLLASSAAGPTDAGKIAVCISIVVIAFIGIANTKKE